MPQDFSTPVEHRRSNGRLYEMLAFAGAIIFLLIVVYIVLGHPGIDAPGNDTVTPPFYFLPHSV